MQAEILCEVGNADSYVAVVRVYVSQVIHDTTPDDNEEELDNQKESYMHHLSGAHAHLPLKHSLNEGRTDLHLDSRGFIFLQSSNEYCVDQMSLHKDSTEDHRGTKAYQ